MKPWLRRSDRGWGRRLRLPHGEPHPAAAIRECSIGELDWDREPLPRGGDSPFIRFHERDPLSAVSVNTLLKSSPLALYPDYRHRLPAPSCRGREEAAVAAGRWG